MADTRPGRKLLRGARLDDTDEEVFEKAAQAGEWVIPGSFEFLDDDDSTLHGRRLQAFRSGFLGLTSFGRTTIASISPATDEQVQQAVEQLGQHLLDHYGAPDRAAALFQRLVDMFDAQAVLVLGLACGRHDKNHSKRNQQDDRQCFEQKLPV